MSIKIFSAATILSGVIFCFSAQTYADSLVVDNQVICNELSTMYWENNQLTISCGSPVDQAVNQPIDLPPVEQPLPVPVNTPSSPPPVTNSGCPDPELNIRTERFAGKGIDREFTLANDSVLVVPFNSGRPGEVQKIALGEPSRGEHFKKTVIISTCPGVYNPDEYDFRSSVDICPVTGLELSFSVIAGESRSDYPFSKYRCVLLPNTQYFINVFQRNAGTRPPFSANTENTCRTNQCGVRVSIR